MTYLNKTAKFSQDEKYRYYLMREWDIDRPSVMCIGLNPSRADAKEDDPTIQHLVKMVDRLGYGRLFMCNLFAWISSEPDDLRAVPDPVGENDHHLYEVSKLCKDVVFCWGSFKQAEDRIKQVAPRFPDAYVFGMTEKRKPLHPLAAAVWQKKLFNFRKYDP